MLDFFGIIVEELCTGKQLPVGNHYPEVWFSLEIGVKITKLVSRQEITIAKICSLKIKITIR
jgi:hypothetical protein